MLLTFVLTSWKPLVLVLLLLSPLLLLLCTYNVMRLMLNLLQGDGC